MATDVKYGGKLVALVPQQGGLQLLEPCQYGKWTDGTWYGCTPNGEGCNLASHKIVEHPDGTITASPSIEVSYLVGPAPEAGQPDTRIKKVVWHGFLEQGVWRDA